MPIDQARFSWGLPLIAMTSIFLVSTVMIMLGPLLVPLAADMDVSVAAAGQLAAVTSLVWGFAAIPIGAISDTYGRRRVLLTGLLLMGVALAVSTLASSYAALFAARVFTGLAAAMIPPTCYAACADLPSPEQANRALSWALAGGMLGSALGMPLVAALANQGDWRTPFLALSIAMAAVCVYAWIRFPPHARSHAKGGTFFSHFRDLRHQGSALWLVVAGNFLLQAASWGTLSYLPAFLMQAYQRAPGAVALPLLLNGLGIVCGVLVGGVINRHSRHRGIAIGALALAGTLIACAFSLHLSLWATVALTAVAGGFFASTQPQLMTALFNFAGEARGIASGMLALSTQIGAMGGAALGGALLSLGGFSALGAGCLAMSVAAAGVMARALPKTE